MCDCFYDSPSYGSNVQAIRMKKTDFLTCLAVLVISAVICQDGKWRWETKLLHSFLSSSSLDRLKPRTARSSKHIVYIYIYAHVCLCIIIPVSSWSSSPSHQLVLALTMAKARRYCRRRYITYTHYFVLPLFFFSLSYRSLPSCKPSAQTFDLALRYRVQIAPLT